MLAGRKLLLADDSATIQKVIDLTFADEGVRVIAFNNGQDAIDHLEEIVPDIVLADVFMPSRSGYEVCKYVKENEKLKHIPVMLLVGSFEPFDEAEARRVGADDILTKPFQSIRRLIDRVGALVNKPPAPKEVPTAELPRVDQPEEDEPKLTTKEIEFTTADTLRLSEDSALGAKTLEPEIVKAAVSGEEKMDTGELRRDSMVESSEVLLDLGDFEPVNAAAGADLVLDLDPDESLKAQFVNQPASEGAPLKAFVEPQVTETVASAAAGADYSYRPSVSTPFEDTQEVPYNKNMVAEAVVDSAASFRADEATPSAGAVPAQLSQEMIDVIARRAVEMLSDKVIREIAWEVVPELAELLIKRQLEEKESQAR